MDGDTYDLPAMIMTAELRQTVHGLPLPTFGHRVKFGNDPKKHIDFSAVTHVAKGQGHPALPDSPRGRASRRHCAGETARRRAAGSRDSRHAIWCDRDDPHETQRRPRSARRPGHAGTVQIRGSDGWEGPLTRTCTAGDSPGHVEAPPPLNPLSAPQEPPLVHGKPRSPLTCQPSSAIAVVFRKNRRAPQPMSVRSNDPEVRVLRRDLQSSQRYRQGRP